MPERAQPAARAGGRIDPAALMKIKSLQLRAKVVVDGYLSGLHRSPMHGFSVEFSEYRPYTPGDDLRFLDWRLYARSDRFHLKRFEEETNLRCWLLVDLSRSMSFHSLAYDKAEYAKTAAATMAWFLTLQRDAVGLVTFDEALDEYLPARYRPGHVHRLMMSLERAPAGRGTDIAAPLEQIARTARKRGLVVLISDLLAPVAAIERQLGCLRARGHDLAVVRVLDPAEVAFSFASESLFFDLESGRELYVDPAAAKAAYLGRFQAHAAEMSAACRKLGTDVFTVTTNQPLDLVLARLLQSRMSGRRVARRSGPLRPRAAGGGP